MTWNNIGNGNTSTAAQANQNFQHIIGWSYTPLAGTLMAATSGVHNLGAARFPWGDLYSKEIAVKGHVYMTTGSYITLNGKAYRGGVFSGSADQRNVSAAFAKTYRTTINPTSGAITVTVSTGIDTTLFTTGSYFIYLVAGCRKESGVSYSTGLDYFYYNNTTSSNIYAVFNCSTFTSANTQTVEIYYEYMRRI